MIQLAPWFLRAVPGAGLDRERGHPGANAWYPVTLVSSNAGSCHKLVEVRVAYLAQDSLRRNPLLTF